MSPTFLREIVEGAHPFVPPAIRDEIRHKVVASRARGILNAPPTSYCPATDAALARSYAAIGHVEGKAANKAAFQRAA